MQFSPLRAGRYYRPSLWPDLGHILGEVSPYNGNRSRISLHGGYEMETHYSAAADLILHITTFGIAYAVAYFTGIA